ncbi:hypothetical protein D3C80_1380350 [compost metagenome]
MIVPGADQIEPVKQIHGSQGLPSPQIGFLSQPSRNTLEARFIPKLTIGYFRTQCTPVSYNHSMGIVSKAKFSKCVRVETNTFLEDLP